MTVGEFLYGAALSERIREICAEDEVDCSVAFWGGAIRDSLFPRWGEQKIRIVCDIAMGCNSQKSLQRFGAPNNGDLKVLDGLHAKIYVSRAGAVVGSANASTNGIGLTNGEERNMEAGVFFARDSTGWQQAIAFFEWCWKTSVPLDQTQLGRARTWAHDPGPVIGPEGRKVGSVLDLIVSYPEAFGDLLTFAENEEIERDELALIDKQYKKDERAKRFEPADRTFIINYPQSDLLFRPSNVILYWLGDSPNLRGYTDVVFVAHEDEVALYGKRQWQSVWKGRGLSVPNVAEAFRQDRERVDQIENGQWAMTALQLAEVLRS